MFGSILKTRINYWSCSKFADWIRGEKKPHALGLREWDEWKNKQRKERPYRFWLSDTGLQKLQDILYFPYDTYRTVKVYIRNRYFDKTHYLNTGLKPGQYYDLDTRILYGLFNELVDFVEIELAHLSLWDRNKKYKFKHSRCVEAAYDYFDWACNLKSKGKLTEQAKASRKIKKLYEWWKNDRPNRKDPYSEETFGLDIDDVLDKKKAKEKQKLFEKTYQMELDQDNEDTAMMIELINLRHHLWT